jgi:hypothetical protein
MDSRGHGKSRKGHQLNKNYLELEEIIVIQDALLKRYKISNQALREGLKNALIYAQAISPLINFRDQSEAMLHLKAASDAYAKYVENEQEKP